jgi:hypothetical protein
MVSCGDDQVNTTNNSLETSTDHQIGNNRYVFEGYIPVKFFQQFLKHTPAGTVSLAAPGKPMGSPGMEVQQRFTPFTIFQLNAAEEPTVFATVSHMEEQY